MKAVVKFHTSTQQFSIVVDGKPMEHPSVSQLDQFAAISGKVGDRLVTFTIRFNKIGMEEVVMISSNRRTCVNPMRGSIKVTINH